MYFCRFMDRGGSQMIFVVNKIPSDVWQSINTIFCLPLRKVKQKTSISMMPINNVLLWRKIHKILNPTWIHLYKIERYDVIVFIQFPNENNIISRFPYTTHVISYRVRATVYNICVVLRNTFSVNVIYISYNMYILVECYHWFYDK